MFKILKMIRALIYTILLVHSFSLAQSNLQSWLRINQVGYLPNAVKVAVLVSSVEMKCAEFKIIAARTDQEVWTSNKVVSTGAYGPFVASYRLNFSDFKESGIYYLQAGHCRSPVFKIHANVYKGTADFLLKYMRQQRCGFNPFLNDSCHTHDGFTIYGPMPDGTHLDVTGGWHDAADYLQYTTTSANATFLLLFAYREHPEVFADEFQANGLPGTNGTPDVLDEAAWGLTWLLKMHPRDDWMFNQIADDRDHRGWRLPNQDTTSYGKGLERPVYFCSGEIQGLYQYKNRTTGVASTAGKMAAAFALGAQIYASRTPELAAKLKRKAVSAYQFGKAKPGVCQTAPCRAPYFYEEDNWVDDMELAAAELHALTRRQDYFSDALQFGETEKITPWLGADTARHYQWYPFMNIGHYELARNASPEVKQKLANYYREGIERVWQRGQQNPFLMGVPFIWCSNNLVTAFVTQCHLYSRLSGDSTYLELEAAMRDWLFGCNPWGISMVIGLPRDGTYPRDPHSAFSNLYDYSLDGGLVDGPVYGSIFNSLKYVALRETDEYAAFQSDLVVYHDDVGDYATNEPTMDGTASLVYYLAALQAEGIGHPGKQRSGKFEYDRGGIIRGDKNQSRLALVFTGDRFADGGEHILKVLEKNQIKGSFFLTGNFYRNPAFKNLIQTLKTRGHYLGAHSDQHLLYCDWEHRDQTLISQAEFFTDLDQNYQAMQKFGIKKADAPFFLPPFEWYNEEISQWCQTQGIRLINFTPGTKSHTDWTVPEMGKKYVPSKVILESILNYEARASFGLNGFILLSHIGTAPERTDKFYFHLGELIGHLHQKNYQFKRIDELLSD